MGIRPVFKFITISDPPEEESGLILPDGVKGPDIGIVIAVGDQVLDFHAGDKVYYRGGVIEIPTKKIVSGEETTGTVMVKLITAEQIVAVEEGD
jgi:hypothetical protein